MLAVTVLAAISWRVCVTVRRNAVKVHSGPLSCALRSDAMLVAGRGNARLQAI